MTEQTKTASRTSGKTGPKGPAAEPKTEEPKTEEPKAEETQVETCGHTINVDGGQKPCVKSKDHKGGHASRVLDRKKLAEIPLDVLDSLETVPTTETIDYGGGVKEERKADQKKIDENVMTNYKNWVANGKKRMSFNDAIAAGLASRYFVPKELEESIRAKLRSAGKFNGVGVRMDSKLRVHAESGRTMLYWTAQDPQVRKTKNEKKEEKKEEETAGQTTVPSGEPQAASAGTAA